MFILEIVFVGGWTFCIGWLWVQALLQDMINNDRDFLNLPKYILDEYGHLLEQSKKSNKQNKHWRWILWIVYLVVMILFVLHSTDWLFRFVLAVCSIFLFIRWFRDLDARVSRNPFN